jgi:hypothetical protein
MSFLSTKEVCSCEIIEKGLLSWFNRLSVIARGIRDWLKTTRVMIVSQRRKPGRRNLSPQDSIPFNPLKPFVELDGATVIVIAQAIFNFRVEQFSDQIFSSI